MPDDGASANLDPRDASTQTPSGGERALVRADPWFPRLLTVGEPSNLSERTDDVVGAAGDHRGL